jgi:uncharacterized phiE125 gp8 family phage protein
MNLQIISGPTVEPVTLADLKAQCRLAPEFTLDDAMLTGYITAARVTAERITRRSLASKVYKAFYDSFPFPGVPIRLPVPPVTAVSAIKFLDSTLTLQTWDPTEYYLALIQSPALIVPMPGFVYPCAGRVPGAVEVDLTAGFGADGGPSLSVVFPDVVESIKQIAQHYYDHPEVISADNDKELPRNAFAALSARKIYEF